MPIQNLEPYLHEHPFFTTLSGAHIALLAGCAKLVRFDEGTLIFRQGDPAEAFYLIRHGKVAIDIPAPTRGALTVQTLSEGEVLGFSWLVAPYTTRFDARAVTLTRAISLDGICLRRKCDDDPVLGYQLLKRFTGIMAERLEATRIQLLDLYAAPKGSGIR